MKKVLLTAAVILCFAAGSMAQGRFSVGAELALPSGDFADVSGLGFGVSARYESPINDNLSWMGTAGYLSFSEKDNLGFKLGLIPIMGGVKYYFTESFNGFYGCAELGLVIATGDGDGNEFAFAPSVGYHLGSLDFSAKYQIVSAEFVDFNWIGVRVAYVLGGN